MPGLVGNYSSSPSCCNDADTNQDIPLQQQLLLHPNMTIPVPLPYSRAVSYDYTKSQQDLPEKDVDQTLPFSKINSQDDSLYTSLTNGKGEQRLRGQRQISFLIFLRGSQIFIRAVVILVMAASFSLVLAAVISYAKAQKAPGHPLDSVPNKPHVPITDKP